MPQDVADRVSHLGQRQHMPKTLTFTDRYGHELFDQSNEVDDEHDDDYLYEGEDDVSFYADDASDVEPADGAAAGVNHAIEEDVSDDPPDAVDDDDNFSDNDSSTIPDDDASAMPMPHEIPNNPSSEATDDGSIPDVYEAEFENESEDDNSSLDEEARDQATADAAAVAENEAEPAGTTGVGEQARKAGVVNGNNTGVSAEDVHVETVDGNDDDDDANDGNDNKPDDGRPDLRPRREKGDPTHLAGKGYEDQFQFLQHTFDHAYCFLTAQMTMKKGLKHFRKEGLDAILAEMSQLHYRKTIRPVDGRYLTREEKRNALRYLMFLKQKRCGRIKARGCADGRIQRLWKSKDETSSPTVMTHSVFLTSIIAALERRNVVSLDIPGAFMQADIDELVHVKLEDELVDILIKIDPKYAEHVTVENGKKVLYVELQKALYGTLQAALLFWKELSSFLTNELGFELNPYDSCVANRVISGKQCTIIWHVDDLMLSHVDEEVLKMIVERLEERFGKEDPLTVTYGKVHDYLGMTIDFSEDGKVKFLMSEYIKNYLSELPEEFDGTAATPAMNHLFHVNDNAEKIDEKKSDLFHASVAKLLYLGMRARPDIQTAVAFLTTRVSAPDVDDYGKLIRLTKYLRDTQDLPLTLEADGSGIIRWWIDASFAVHPDMKSHTGATMSMGSLCMARP